MNFSTFIEAPKRTTLDVTVTPTSFELSDLSSSPADDDSVDTTNAVAGITATTFVLENNMRKEVDAEKAVAAVKQAAIAQRQETQQEIKEVQAKVQRLREQMEEHREREVKQSKPKEVIVEQPKAKKPAAAAAADSVEIIYSGPEVKKNAINQPKRVQPLDDDTIKLAPVASRPTVLQRFATSPSLKKEVSFGVVQSSNSTTDLAALRRKEPLDGEAKRSRLQQLRMLGETKHSEPILPVHHPIDAVDLKARMKSRPQKLKMLRAVSTLDGELGMTVVKAGLTSTFSPSVVVGTKAPTTTTGTVHNLAWPGDEHDAGTGDAFIAPIDETSAGSPTEEVAVASTAAAAAAAASNASDESESMDAEMAVDLTTVDQSLAHVEPGSRYSILVQAPTAEVDRFALPRSASDLMDISNTDARLMKSSQPSSMEQLEFIMANAHLSGLFGEHLKRTREDALLRILDDIREYKNLAVAERLPLARSIFQMYLSESAARENHIALGVVSDDVRQTIKKRIRGGNNSENVFDLAETTIKSHLANKEVPKFVTCDLYKTLGFKKGGKIKAAKKVAQDAFPAAESALFRRVEEPVVAAPVAPVVAASAPVKSVAFEEEDDERSDEEEESSDGSPVSVKPSAVVAKPAPVVSSVEEKRAIFEQEAVPSKEDVSVDSILSNPGELETFLSFVESTDKKTAQKASANVQFLQKVAQFNSAEETDRPKVARAIYDSFLASPEKPESIRRDQKGQTEVDVTELRKKQLVSRFVNMMEKQDAPCQKGFFDKAARDVEAFMEPAFNKYIAARKNGTIVVKKQERNVPKAAAAVIAAPVAVAPPKVEISRNMNLAQAVENGGAVLNAFVTFAVELGRASSALFLQRIALFKKIEDPVSRTTAASKIMDEFIRPSGAHVLDIADHIRSGPEVRWGVFSKRNLIKVDFFDSVVAEVERVLEGTWNRFVEQEEEEQVVVDDEEPINESLLPMSFGMTLQRREIEDEVLRRLREEHDSDDENGDDSGVEDSPDVPATVPRGVMSHRDLDLSPSTAADLLSRLENQSSDADTVILSSRSIDLPTAQSIFQAPPPTAIPSQVRTTIPVQRSEATTGGLLERLAGGGRKPTAGSGVWPSRSEKLVYAEGIDGKKKVRYVVLKNKSLYVWKSEADYKKNKDPKTVLDMDNLVRCTIVRDNSKNALLNGVKWNLRINFDGLNYAICLGHDSQQALQDWKNDLLDSAPHVTI